MGQTHESDVQGSIFSRCGFELKSFPYPGFALENHPISKTQKKIDDLPTKNDSCLEAVRPFSVFFVG